jgi:protein-S-isoprenylcysteine O-methyltransferase Ste14
MMPSETIKWPRLYAAATLAGVALGVLLVLGVLPAVPHQLTTWMRSVDDKVVVVLALIVGGALMGLALAAVAHLGVLWQLRQRSRRGTG